MKNNKRFPVITKRIIISVIVFGFFLCTVIFSVGYWSFSNQFKNQHYSTILAIANASRECINPDKLYYYKTSKERDEEFNNVEKILQDFVDKFDLNLLYVSIVEPPDYTNITYIFNVVKKGGKLIQFPVGYTEYYTEKSYCSCVKRVYENKESLVRNSLNSRSGSHITANIPVFDSQGNVIAVIGAQKSVQEYIDARISYIRIVVIAELIFSVIFIFLFGSFFNSKFINPIKIIAKETDHFASWGGKPSDKLLSIKNNDEIGILAHSVHQMENDVCKNIEELTKVTAEKERISTELNLAAKIQMGILPKGYPAFPERTDFDLYATMNPAKEVGGDLYDYLLLDDNRLLITVGDVSGKGVPAALFMMTAKTLIDSFAKNGRTPVQIFEKANAQLCIGNASSLFVTCWLGILDLETGELKYVNAGHPQPVLYKDNKFAYLSEKPNFVLGAMEGMKYEEHSLKLNAGDRLFVYSDGVTEAINKQEVLFGEERLLNSIKETESLNVSDTLAKIRDSIVTFTDGAEQFDDITMLQVVWKPDA
ncbi:MAG: serine/threonine-protein phosphatase [Treponema sp.]|nr:serine/threonine-protein phosphatase [Treponema sp.]